MAFSREGCILAIGGEKNIAFYQIIYCPSAEVINRKLFYAKHKIFYKLNINLN